METKANLFEPFFDKVEQYGKDSIELAKLKSAGKVAEVGSALFSQLLLAVISLLFIMTLGISLGLYLGDILGKDFYGFLVVAAIYALIALIVYFINPAIKGRIGDSIVKQLLD